ncbi:BLUF domain-containing protein [Brevundimonas sp. A19_0]|uniref:BLUF domain-containing protein n=1 Tax=Brevundimonas sp. A19_0 TaxID=2821087 RepID=UPI001ADC67D9|nr:BLUF domain-containing protein [Brevundimonas sp. A19_0]MBO9501329.1 BLUF domain-containing protein [Brevundimonas sp. A19_0]
MLYRLTYVSDAMGSLGTSLLSMAHVLGVSEVNNRRDHLTGAIAIEAGHIVQVIEGTRIDIDRLMNRLTGDPRHANLRVLADRPVADRLFQAPMAHCHLETWNTRLDLADLSEGRIAVDLAESLLAECARGEDDSAVRTGTDG